MHPRARGDDAVVGVRRAGGVGARPRHLTRPLSPGASHLVALLRPVPVVVALYSGTYPATLPSSYLRAIYVSFSFYLFFFYFSLCLFFFFFSRLCSFPSGSFTLSIFRPRVPFSFSLSLSLSLSFRFFFLLTCDYNMRTFSGTPRCDAWRRGRKKNRKNPVCVMLFPMSAFDSRLVAVLSVRAKFRRAAN
ncbi:hypothetical protein PUN28_015449 [Cardiocondyla obscurior]|uniref:Transmembrane protein n=1 Tax=Cardiocondyla obscurior TaxID=286306 RepID=A0AAW2EY60_9HYME